jgi:hypothetical protein
VLVEREQGSVEPPVVLRVPDACFGTLAQLQRRRRLSVRRSLLLRGYLRHDEHVHGKRRRRLRLSDRCRLRAGRLLFAEQRIVQPVRDGLFTAGLLLSYAPRQLHERQRLRVRCGLFRTELLRRRPDGRTLGLRLRHVRGLTSRTRPLQAANRTCVSRCVGLRWKRASARPPHATRSPVVAKNASNTQAALRT